MSHFEWEDVDINAGNMVYGVISNIDKDNLTADVEGVGTNIPIHYHCEEDAIEDSGKSFDVDYPDDQDEQGSTAFSDDDEVLVMFRRINNEDPVIIGFANEAKPCATRYVLFSFSEDGPTGSNSRCMVWDIVNNAYANIPGITFPVAYSEIEEWISTKEDPSEQRAVFKIDVPGGPSQSDINGIISMISDAESSPYPCQTGSAWVTDLECYKEKTLDWEAIPGEPLYSDCDTRNRQELYVVSCDGLWVDEYYVIHEKWIEQNNDLYVHSVDPLSNMTNKRLEPNNDSGIYSYYRISVHKEGYDHHIDDTMHGGGGLCLVDDTTFDARVTGNKYIFNYYTPIGHMGILETTSDDLEGQFEMLTRSSDYVVAQAYIYQCVPPGEDRTYIIGAQADKVEDATGMSIDPTSFNNNSNLANALRETIESYYDFKGYASNAYVFLMNYMRILY